MKLAANVCQILRDLPKIILHCLGWCHVMTLGLAPSFSGSMLNSGAVTVAINSLNIQKAPQKVCPPKHMTGCLGIINNPTLSSFITKPLVDPITDLNLPISFSKGCRMPIQSGNLRRDAWLESHPEMVGCKM